jgi:nucleoside-diphosphate-sugar epimerase
MAKLTIFGGTGFVGSNFAKQYPDCIIAPRDSNSVEDMEDVLYLISTTHNYHVYDDVHKDINTNLNKLMDVLPNVKGTFNFVSSWFVYGNGYGKYNPAREGDPCNPKGFYSITKKAAEDLVESYCKTFKKNYRILRLCNVIGGDAKAERRKNALEYLIKNITLDEPIKLYNGDNYRNFLHVEDVANAIKLVMDKGRLNEIYNIGNEESTSINAIVKYVVDKTNSNSPVSYMDAPEFHQIVQTPNFFMDCEKLRYLGFRQKYTTFDAVDKILKNINN